MRATDFETILPDHPVTELPATLSQTPSRAAPFLLLALALPAATLSLFPFAMIADHLARDPAVAAQRPMTVLALALAFLVWLIVFGWPIAVRASRAMIDRHVAFAPGFVTVTDTGLLGARTWNEPLANYDGLTHRVKSSLSGTRHELILVHPNASRSVLLRASARISQSEIETTAALFGCPEIAPRVIYASFKTAVSMPRPALATAA
jgi:hypothetical protein